jgi:hypothetical protein
MDFKSLIILLAKEFHSEYSIEDIQLAVKLGEQIVKLQVHFLVHFSETIAST